MGLTSIPVVNDVIQELGLPKVVCDLLAQACMASGMFGSAGRGKGGGGGA